MSNILLINPIHHPERLMNQTTDTESIEIEPTELQWRVIYSLFLPSVRLASLFGLPLREMKDWLGVAYLHELKRRKLNQSESAKLLNVSRRTVIDLTRKVRDNFFAPERHEGLSRRILFMLWAESLSEGRLKQALITVLGELDEDEYQNALAELLSNDLITRQQNQGTDSYALKKDTFRLYHNNWIKRVDALNNQLEHLADTVMARFFRQSSDSFVRTVTLTMKTDDVPKLEALYRDVIFPALVEFDKAAADSDDVQNMELNISWAPKDFILSHLEPGEAKPPKDTK